MSPKMTSSMVLVLVLCCLHSQSQAQEPPRTEHQPLHQIILGSNARACAFDLRKHGTSSPTRMSISNLKNQHSSLPAFLFPLGEKVFLLLDMILRRLCVKIACSPGQGPKVRRIRLYLDLQSVGRRNTGGHAPLCIL